MLGLSYVSMYFYMAYVYNAAKKQCKDQRLVDFPEFSKAPTAVTVKAKMSSHAPSKYVGGYSGYGWYNNSNTKREGFLGAPNRGGFGSGLLSCHLSVE